MRSGIDTAAGTDCTLCDQPVNTGDYRLFRSVKCTTFDIVLGVDRLVASTYVKISNRMSVFIKTVRLQSGCIVPEQHGRSTSNSSTEQSGDVVSGAHRRLASGLLSKLT